MLLCIVLAVLVIGRGILSIATEQTAITPVIDRFMHLMNQRDDQAAYQLFSSRAQRQTPIADLRALLDEPNYVLFDGYQSTTIDATNLTSTVDINQDLPQGQVATVSGSVNYTDGTKGSFRATLEKENGDWRLFFINVTVPPSKMKPAS
jgi:ABC-type arginine transport system ATPase subunit